jgi:hypothetical protein
MVPQVAVYETEVEVDDEDIKYIEDYLDQFFNDDVKYCDTHLSKLVFNTVDCDSQHYYKHYFCEYSDLDFQCTEYEVVKDGQ